MIERRTGPDGRVSVSAEADSLERMLVEAGSALCEVLAAARGGRPDRVPVLIESHDPRRLLGGLLEDLLLLAHAEDFRAVRIERLHVDGAGLRAAVSGRTGAGAASVPRLATCGLTPGECGRPWRAEFVLDCG